MRSQRLLWIQQSPCTDNLTQGFWSHLIKKFNWIVGTGWINKVILEIKAVEALNDVHMAQILTYLKLPGSKLGFPMNFNVELMKDGLKRIANNL